MRHSEVGVIVFLLFVWLTKIASGVELEPW